MSYFTGHPYLTACYCSVHPWQWNHSPPGRPEPPMSLSLKLLSPVWAHPLFLPSRALRPAPNCLRIDDLSADPEETETFVSLELMTRTWMHPFCVHAASQARSQRPGSVFRGLTNRVSQRCTQTYGTGLCYHFMGNQSKAAVHELNHQIKKYREKHNIPAFVLAASHLSTVPRAASF